MGDRERELRRRMAATGRILDALKDALPDYEPDPDWRAPKQEAAATAALTALYDARDAVAAYRNTLWWELQLIT